MFQRHPFLRRFPRRSSLAVLAALGPLLLSACQSTAQPDATTPEPTAEAEADIAAPALRDTIIVGSWQEPQSFHTYANSQAIRVELDGLFRPGFVGTRNFEFQANPDLVDGDLPSLENGGAVINDIAVKAGEPIFSTTTFEVVDAPEDTYAKQLVVTGKIKAGLKWEDGEPLTAGDFVYAFDSACDPESGALDVTYCPKASNPAATGLLASYEATDDTTLVATFVPGALDPLYFNVVFGPQGPPIPQHVFQDMKPVDLLKDDRANGGPTGLPLGWGPYKMKQWDKGDKMLFEANPNWVGETPKTPNLIYKFFADSVALASAVIAGDIDSASGTTGVSIDQYPYLSSVAKNGDIVLDVDKNAASFEMLFMNFNDPSDATLKAPHPLFSDFNVRKAVAMALDRQQMVDTIFFGQSSVVEQPHLPQMASYDPALGTIAFDPEASKKLLDAAGWVPGEDGTRVKDGVKAAVTLLTTSGNPLRQKSTQIIQSNLGDIGIAVELDYQPSSVVFSDNGINHRLFEMAEFANVFSNVDPGSWWFGRTACGQIPTPDNGFAGNNLAGWCDDKASEAVTQAAYLTLDMTERKAAWKTALEQYFATGYNLIPLFIRPAILARVPELEGPALDSTEYFTWNAATWTLKDLGE